MRSRERELLGEDTAEQTASVAIGVGTLTGAATAASATRFLLAGQGCTTGIPRTLHPTGVTIDGSDAVGAVVMNTAIIIGFAVLCVLLVRVALAFGSIISPQFFAGLDAQGFLRIPSLPLLIFQVFYQGTTLAGMVMLYDHTWWHVVTGLVVIVMCFTVPLAVAYTVWSAIGTQAVYAKVAGRTKYWPRVLLGHGEWTNTARTTLFVERYSSVVRRYHPDKTWYIIIEYGASFATSALTATAPSTYIGCGHVKAAMSVVFALPVIVTLVYKPHAKTRDSAVDASTGILMSSAMGLLAAGFYGEMETEFLFSASTFIIKSAMVMLAAKAVMDVINVLYLICTGRQKVLQEDVYRIFNEREVDDFNAFDLNGEDSGMTDYMDSPDSFLLATVSDAGLSPSRSRTASQVSLQGIPTTDALKRTAGRGRTEDYLSPHGQRGASFSCVSPVSPLNTSLSHLTPRGRGNLSGRVSLIDTLPPSTAEELGTSDRRRRVNTFYGGLTTRM